MICSLLCESFRLNAKAFENVLKQQFMYNYNDILAALKLIFQ